MTRHCFVCGRVIYPDTVEKEYMFDESLCSYNCRNIYKRKNLRERRERYISEGRCRTCGKELPPKFTWDKKNCPDCIEAKKNYNEFGVYTTDYRLMKGLYL